MKEFSVIVLFTSFLQGWTNILKPSMSHILNYETQGLENGKELYFEKLYCIVDFYCQHICFVISQYIILFSLIV